MAHDTFSAFFRIVLKKLSQQRPRALLSEDPQRLHQAFFEIASQYRERFPALGELHFITAGAHPYSPELTEALDLLQMSGAITRQNPSYEFFSVRLYPDTETVVKRELGELIDGDESRAVALDEIVNSLDEALVTDAA